MGRFKIWMIIGGAFLAWYGFQEWRISAEAKTDPQVLTCAALAKDGYGTNAHIKMTDFLLSPGGYVYEEKEKGGSWETVWIPVVPLGGAYHKMVLALPEDAEIPSPKSFNVILQTEHASGASMLGKIGGKKQLQGVVINEIDSLDSETKKLLKDSYPGIDLDNCWIVEHKRETKGAMLSLLLLLLGVGLAGGGVFFLVKGRK
jgi:hypothetical protein